jgi:hypothetical protein
MDVAYAAEGTDMGNWKTDNYRGYLGGEEADREEDAGKRR